MRLKVICKIWFAISILMCTAASSNANTRGKNRKLPEQLQVSRVNPHLLETKSGKPVFLNNYTLWFLLRNGSREDISEMFSFCHNNSYNMVSLMVLDFPLNKGDQNGISKYGVLAFENDEKGLPNPMKPITTKGNNPGIPGQYDFWDHLDFVVDEAASMGLYVGLHPAWGQWFSGEYGGEKPGDPVIFNESKAYNYGHWLGERYRNRENIIWMLGGDRSAVYDEKTRNVGPDRKKDYRNLYRAMAEGIADGENGTDNFDGVAEYSHSVMSYHPRKWAPNSSEWFHNDTWLTFNSIQDTPADQVKSIPHDYRLQPVKPTWLYEGRYEEYITAWGVRYQAYQTVLSGGFGHTYGGESMYKFLPGWQEKVKLNGSMQMKYLYKVARQLWNDRQFTGRTPDQDLIVGDQGNTYGDGISVGDGDGTNRKNNGSSDRITAMRGKDGNWAVVYSANGRNITLDFSRLSPGKWNAYWFDPRNGMWQKDDAESEKMQPFRRNFNPEKGNKLFDPPGTPGADNDWVLVLIKK